MQGFSTGSVGSPSKPLQKQLLRPSYNLWVHDERFSKQDLVLNPDCFPGVKVGDLLEIFHPIAVNSGSNTTSSSNAGHASATSAGRTTARQGSKSPSSKPRHSGPGTGTDREKTLVLQVSSLDRDTTSKQSQLQISIAQHVAALFELQARTDVVVRRVEKESIAAHFIELNFRDQYVGRSDMWRLKTLLTGTCVYQGKKITSLGIRAQIKDVVVGGRKVACAYITENTKTIFRSETAKYFLFVQMSREMWEFDEDGELYFEKCVHGFLPQLFARWKDLGANHVVSIVLFARIYYHNNQEDADMGKKLSLFEEDVVDADDSQSIPILIDGHGRPYRDFYRVVVDWEIRSDWSHVLIPLKKEFISFQRDVLQQPTLDGSTILAGANSTASEGNILEAINLALNPFDRHYIDRDLSRTGLSIVIVTPGPGLFEADKKLLRLTAQRMVDNGIGLDLVCLNKPPLYTVPLFQFMSKDWAGSSGGGWGMPGTSGELDATVGGGDKRWSTGGSGTTFGKASDRSFERKGATIPSQFATGSGSGLAGASTGSERRLEAWDPLYYDDSSPDNPDKMFYGVPHWVMCSFWTRDEGANKFGFALRCKMYEVQMMGVMEQIGSTIVAPYLDKTAGPVVDMSIGAAVLENEAMHAEAAQEKGGVKLTPGGVRFEIGGDDDEESPAMSVTSETAIDCDQYDDMVFAPAPKLRSMLKHRSNSVVNAPILETEAMSNVKGNRSSQQFLPNTVRITGGSVSVSPEGMMAATVAAAGVGGRQLQHRQTQDTIRSVDSDNANTQRPPLHYGSTFYHPWEDSDTMTTEERMALLKAKARIDLVRQPSQSNVGGPLRSVQSYTSLTNVPHTGSKVSIANSDPFESGKLQRMPWQQPANPNLARKGMRIASDSTGVAELKPVRDSAARASYDGSDAGQPEPVDAEDAPVVGSSTSLAPIRIHSSASHLNVRPHRDALSGSGSYKGGHSPLNNFDYLRQYPKLSPGKTSNQALRSVLHSSVRPNFINPSNPSRNAIRATNQVFRWQHAFPYVNVPARADTIIHWKSLSTPACLPITTDYFPSAEELSELYVEYTYTVSPADDATPYQSRGDANSGRSETFRIEALLTELVGQRLAQGFQLIVNSATGVGANVERASVVPVTVGPVSPINSRQSDKQGSKRLLGSLSEMSQRQLRNSTVQRLSNPTPPQQNLNASLSSESLPSFPISVPYYLSLGNHVHRLFYDASGQNVEVKRYVRKITYSTLPVPYACGIWRKNDQFYRPKRLTFTYPPVILYNWNYLDHLISGYQEEMTENLRFWRTRFLLIPLETTSNLNPFLNPQGENLDDEEIRLVGFEKFIEVFERSRWVSPWEEEESAFSGASGTSGGAASKAAKKSKVAKVANKLQIRMTTFSASRFIRDEVLQQKETASTSPPPAAESASAQSFQPNLLRRGSLNSLILPASTPAPTPVHSQSSNSLITSPLFTKTTPFTTIAQAMQAPPPTGITFCDRRWHFVMYERVFVGSECVDWMVRNFSDIDSREEAVEFGNALLQTGMLEHASRKHRFLDGHYFYRIRSQHLRQGAANHTKDKEKGPSWFAARGRTGSASDSDFPEPGTPSTGPVASHTDATGTTDTSAPPAFAARVEPTPPAERFCLSRRMVIDLDPQRRSPRRETAVLHYDTVHNPRICFHFQLHWLVCSPRWIEDLVAGWARVAEKCGFKMIEAGIEQAEPLSDVNPFQSVTRILPVIDQPALPHASLPATFYLTELVRKFNFVLDVEADSCFPPNSVEWSYDRGRGYKRTQWVHRSGVAFIQIGTAQEGGGFWWVANRMHLTGSGSNSDRASTAGGGGGGNKEGSGGKTTLEKNTDPETLRRAFTDFCEDAGALQQFWDDVRSRFHGVFGVAPSSTGKSASDGSTDAEQDQSGERTKSSSSSATSSLQSNARDAPIIQGALTKLTAEVEFEDIGDDAGATVVRVAEGSILDPEFFSPPPHGHQRALSAGTKTVLDDGSTGKTGHGVHLPDGKFEVESKRGDLPKEALGPNGKDGEQLEQRGDA